MLNAPNPTPNIIRYTGIATYKKLARWEKTGKKKVDVHIKVNALTPLDRRPNREYTFTVPESLILDRDQYSYKDTGRQKRVGFNADGTAKYEIARHRYVTFTAKCRNDAKSQFRSFVLNARNKMNGYDTSFVIGATPTPCSSLSYRRNRRTVLNSFMRYADELGYVIESGQKINSQFISKVFAEYGVYCETGKIVSLTRKEISAWFVADKKRRFEESRRATANRRMLSHK